MGDEFEGSFGVVAAVLDALVKEVAEGFVVAGDKGCGGEFVVVGRGWVVGEGFRGC